MNILKKSEMNILPGQIAFFIVLSIIPILTLLVASANLFSISLNSVIDVMTKTFPKDVSELLIPFIEGKGFDFSIGIFTVIGFYLASNGPYSIIVASNTLYQVEHSDPLKRHIKALVLTILLMALFLFILLVLGLSNVILKGFLGMIKITSLARTFYFLFNLLKWPFAFLIIYAVAKVLYTMAPDKSIPSKSVTKGALFSTFFWTLATAIYSYYVSNFANYSIFYGGLSNIIIFMIWVYINSYILVIGIAINAQEYHNVNDSSKNG